MNAVIYARYSSDNQREESIEGQLRECKEYADQNGITVVRTYIDRALSAKTDSRPQFQQMIHDSATHTFEAVLVWKLDRFSRNRYDSAHYKRILKNNRVHVVSVTEPISNTPEGIMLESLLEGMAGYYSAELAEKVSRGHKENALKAKFNGGPVPLGYRIDSEHHYQIDPTTAPVVQEAFQRYAAGESIRSIIESLNARGIRNGRGNPFTKNSFQTLLKNRRYLGEYRYKDTVIPDAIPAIIDPDCFDAVQRRCEIHRQAPAHNKTDVHYLLTTKLFCGKCGTMMAGESGRSHTGTVHCYYKCGTRKRSGKEACSLKPVRKEPLEQFVVQTALEKVLNDRVIDLLADKLLEYQSKENTRLPVLQAELKEVKRRIDNLVAAIEQGILTPSTKTRMEELEQQREALETSILQEQIEKPPITREKILFWFDQFRHGDPADIAFQEKVIDCFVNSIYLFDDRIVVNFNYQEGGRPVSLEEVLGSFLDGNGAPKRANNVRCWLFSFVVTVYNREDGLLPIMSALFLFPVFQHLNGQKSGHCVQQQRWTDVIGVSPFSFSSIPTLEWSENLIAACLDAGVPISSIGLQTHQHQGYMGRERLEEILERFSVFGLPLHFTENTLLSGHLMPADIVDLNDYQVESWPSTPEGEERQRREWREMYEILFSHPRVEAITGWDFADGAWLNAPSGLLRADNSPKPSYRELQRLIHEEWTSQGELHTDENGVAELAGFRETYSLHTDRAQAEVQLTAQPITQPRRILLQDCHT